MLLLCTCTHTVYTYGSVHMLHVCGHSLLQVEGFDPYTGVTPSGWNVCFKCELCSPLHVCAYHDMHGQEFNLHTLCKPRHYWRRQQSAPKTFGRSKVFGQWLCETLQCRLTYIRGKLCLYHFSIVWVHSNMYYFVGIQILPRGTCAVASKEVICHVSHKRSPERCIGMNESIAVT